MKKISSKSRFKTVLAIIASIVVVIAVFMGAQVFNYQQLMKKEKNVVLLRSGGEQEIYILGTIHNRHFSKDSNYSLADIQSAIETIKPDILLVEVRQSTVDTYNALDGPAEMIFSWCYAKEHGIEVHGIDWYEITADMQSNSTSKERDDKIYENIQVLMQNSKKVMIVVGATHRVEQRKRFLEDGFTEVKPDNPARFFGSVAEDDFTYPVTMEDEIRKKQAYLQSGLLDEIKENIQNNTKEYEYWTTNAESMVDSLEMLLDKAVIPNRLYID